MVKMVLMYHVVALPNRFRGVRRFLVDQNLLKRLHASMAAGNKAEAESVLAELRQAEQVYNWFIYLLEDFLACFEIQNLNDKFNRITRNGLTFTGKHGKYSIAATSPKAEKISEQQQIT